MKRTIWKYRLVPGEAIVAPDGAYVLSVALQQGVPTIWVLVDPSEQRVPMPLNVFGTGWEMNVEMDNELGRFIGTYQTDSLVFHVFQPEAL